VRLRAMARQRGLSMSEYAFRGDDGSEIVCASEEEVYGVLGLPLVPPDLREDRGEIEAAIEGRLPHLLDLADLQGDLHVHTTKSDGQSSPLEIARAARALGLSYAVIADHTWSLGIVRGLTAEQVMAQRAEINEANRLLGGTFKLLAGAEVEVRADGSLDLPDEVLAHLDIVVASVHTGLRQSRETITSRMLAAIHNPHVDVIAHPTGRLIGEREAADLDLEAVFRAAAQAGTALEVNSRPKRLDLRPENVRRAIQLGVKLAIGSDAHRVDGFSDLRYGAATARRGWATREDVVNALPLKGLLQWAARLDAS
jgi:DNA polymerase (family 10)